MRKGKLLIVSAPAGTGKTTLINRIKDEMPHVKETVSCTTRKPRKGEVDGVDYFFISREQFEDSLEKEKFLESVKLYDFYYGTLKEQVDSLQNQGKHVILVIDTQGAKQLKSKVSATFIFIKPPSLEVLKRRLVIRGTESEEKIKQRLDWVEHEMKLMPIYDHVIVNDDLETAYGELKEIIERDMN